jgi:hypothetical protein
MKFVLFLARAINLFYATVKPRGKKRKGLGVGEGQQVWPDCFQQQSKQLLGHWTGKWGQQRSMRLNQKEIDTVTLRQDNGFFEDVN